MVVAVKFSAKPRYPLKAYVTNGTQYWHPCIYFGFMSFSFEYFLSIAGGKLAHQPTNNN